MNESKKNLLILVTLNKVSGKTNLNKQLSKVVLRCQTQTLHPVNSSFFRLINNLISYSSITVHNRENINVIELIFHLKLLALNKPKSVNNLWGKIVFFLQGSSKSLKNVLVIPKTNIIRLLTYFLRKDLPHSYDPHDGQ